MKRIVKGIMVMVVMVVMGCNSGGGIKEGEEGKAKKGDGSVIDLKVIGEKIKSVVEFVEKVKEVETLVKSVDELAKAIGAKIKNAYELDTTNSNHNGSLIAGVFQVILTAETKLKALKQSVETDSLKAKVIVAEQSSKKFLDKLKSENIALGKEDASDVDSKAAFLKSDAAGAKGAKELIELNTAIDELLKSVNGALEIAISELTTSSKAATLIQNK
ncbi:Vsp/OspC family lipoprotein [Borrelia duttonii]